MLDRNGYLYLTLTLIVLQGMGEAAKRVDLSHPRVKRSLHIREKSPDAMFGLHGGEHLTPGNKFRTAAGTTKVKMEESYLGLPVVGESVVMEMDDDGLFTGEISGQLLEEIEVDVPSIQPKLSVLDAFTIALEETEHNVEDVDFDPDVDASLQIHVKGIEDIHAQLVYRLNYRVETQHLTTRPTFIIDANEGDVITTWDAMSMSSWRKMHKRKVNENIQYKLVEGEGGNKKIGKHMFGLDLPELRVQTLGNGTCVLENQYALIYNCKSSYSCKLNGREPHHFDCEAGNKDIVNGAYSPLNDALFYVGLAYEMYADWYEISDPLKTKEINGGRCVTRVHYGNLYENAFWDGKQITFGDGRTTMYPLTSLNVVAHEISHGFTEKNAGLIYSGESGGMNEAFSDMAGEAAEDYLKHKIDWMVGYSIWKPENKSMRYFDDPTRDGRSIKKAEDMCFMMDPHLSSGVYNKAFYVLSNTPGWCVRKAFHIFVVANDMYWKPSTGFRDGACGVLRAARDLGYNEEDVKSAFRAVGVEPCDRAGKNAMGTLLPMKNDSTLIFKLNNHLDSGLDYSYTRLLVLSQDPVYVTVTTPYYDYTVGPKSKISRPRGARKTPFINVGRQCYNSECSISIYAPLETYALVIPMAYFKTLAGGVDLKTRRYGSSTNKTDYIISSEFTLPSVIIENRATVFVVGTSASGRGSFYISHEKEPNIDSYEYDVRGSIKRRDGSESPGWLCTPKKGTYYLKAKASTDMKDVRIELAAWLTSTDITPPNGSETSTASVFREEREMPSYVRNY